MTPEKLAAKLKSMYDSAGTNEKLAMIHLFGILYANQLENRGVVTEIVGIAFPQNPSYHSEVHKGKRLARYVQLKEEWASRFNLC